MKNRRSPSLAAAPVLSPRIARADVWVGHGAAAQSRGIGRRPGIAGVEKTYFNSNITLTLTMMTMLTLAFVSGSMYMN